MCNFRQNYIIRDRANSIVCQFLIAKKLYYANSNGLWKFQPQKSIRKGCPLLCGPYKIRDSPISRLLKELGRKFFRNMVYGVYPHLILKYKRNRCSVPYYVKVLFSYIIRDRLLKRLYHSFWLSVWHRSFVDSQIIV